MKKLIQTLVFGLLLACTKTKDTEITISVLEDITEKDFIVTPFPKIISDKFEFEDDIWKTVIFRYARITSLVHNSQDVLTLDKQHHLLGNELERRQKVKSFEKQIHSLLGEPKDNIAFNNSSIWLPLVEEIKLLQKHERKAYVYLFSDLRENTKWFSTYRTSDLRQLKENIESAEQLFLERADGISASNLIHITVVYQPQNLLEDEYYSLLRNLYAKLFDKLGISIDFVTNIN